jgi:Uma2 family endonuclease
MAGTTLLTSDQFLALPEEFDQHGNSLRQELICGELVDKPPSSKRNAIIQSNILKALFVHLNVSGALGLMVLSRATFVVSANNVFVPDVSVIPLSRLNPTEQIYLQGAPDLAIEVITPTDLEIHLKRKIDAYLTYGSTSVWVVYPEAKSVMVYRADGISNLKTTRSIGDSLLPGFSCPVAAFFELT